MTASHTTKHGSSQGAPDYLEPGADHSTILATDSDALRLIDCYFATVGLMLPVVSKTALLADYRALRNNRGISHFSTKSILLSMVFAHAAAAMGEIARHTYYRQALRCLDNRKLRGASLELGTMPLYCRLY